MGMIDHRLSSIVSLTQIWFYSLILIAWVCSAASKVLARWASSEGGGTEGESSRYCGTDYPFAAIGSKIADPTAGCSDVRMTHCIRPAASYRPQLWPGGEPGYVKWAGGPEFPK